MNRFEVYSIWGTKLDAAMIPQLKPPKPVLYLSTSKTSNNLRRKVEPIESRRGTCHETRFQRFWRSKTWKHSSHQRLIACCRYAQQNQCHLQTHTSSRSRASVTFSLKWPWSIIVFNIPVFETAAVSSKKILKNSMDPFQVKWQPFWSYGSNVG